ADYATVAFSSKKIKVPAGKSVKVTLTFTEPKKGDAKQFPLYSGYVVATPATEGSPSVHVPYIGLKGKFTIRVFNPTTKKFLGYVVSGFNGAALFPTGRQSNLDNDGNPSSVLFDWHGQVLESEDPTAKPIQLPAGKYQLVVASQRKLSKGAYPADYEIFDMGSFNVIA
ncbi:hypothetical protein BGZ95_001539, partial [Linnemannia exigua]